MLETKEPYIPSDWFRDYQKSADNAGRILDANATTKRIMEKVAEKRRKGEREDKEDKKEEKADSHAPKPEPKKEHPEPAPPSDHHEPGKTEDAKTTAHETPAEKKEAAPATHVHKHAEKKGHHEEHGSHHHEHDHHGPTFASRLRRLGLYGLLIAGIYAYGEYNGKQKEREKNKPPEPIKVEQQTDTLGTQKPPVDVEQASTFEQAERRLIEQHGQKHIQDIRVRITENQKKNEGHAPIEVLSFEDAPERISEQDLKAYAESFPVAFRPLRISYTDQNVFKKDHIICADASDERVMVYRGCFKDGVREIFNVINHELGHDADWTRSDLLSYEEAILLFDMANTRYTAADKFASNYPNEILDSRAAEIREYFADVVMQYFIDRDVLAPGDRRLVEFVIEKTQPNYDYEAGRAMRRQILNKY